MVRQLMWLGFFLGLTYVLIQVPALALFLETFGAEGLPYLYIAVAVMSSVVSLAYLWLAEHISYTHLLIVNLVLIIGGTIGIRYLLNITEAKWALFVLPVWFEMVTMLGGLGFFTLINRLFNVRQGKRLIGVVRMTMWLAQIGSGLVIPLLVAIVGTVNLFLFAAVSTSISLTFLLNVLRQYGYRLRESIEAYERYNHRRPNISFNRYIASIFALTLVWWMAFYFVDNVFLGRLNQQYADADEITTFLGVFYGIVQGVVLVAGNWLTGGIIERLGIRFAALVMPILVTLCMGTLLVLQVVDAPLIAVFVLAAAAKLTNGGLGFSVDQNTRLMLYQPLPPEERTRIQTIGQGVIEPLSKGVAGAVLLFLTARLTLDVQSIVYFFVPIAAVWIATVIATFRQYPAALKQAISSRRVGLQHLDVLDETSIQVLQQGLESLYPEAVIYSLGLLEQVRPEAVETALATLLAHPSFEVRQHTLERIAQHHIVSAREAVRQRVETEMSSQVREQALLTLASLTDENERPALAEQLITYMDDTNWYIRRGAMVALLRHVNGAVHTTAEAKLTELARSQTAEERQLAAHVIGSTGSPSHNILLEMLLNDKNLDVRRAAIRAVDTTRFVRMGAHVIYALNHPRLRSTATQTILAAGEAALPEIRSLFNWQTLDNRVRIMRILGRIRTERTVEFLKDKLDYPDFKVRTQVLLALSACGYAASADERETVAQLMRLEIEQAVQLTVIRDDLGTPDAAELLKDALTSQILETHDRALLLLSFLYEPQVMLSARNALLHGDPEHRSYALEVLDNTLSLDLKPYVVPLFDDVPTKQRLTALFPQQHRSRSHRLQQMIVGIGIGDHTWIRACALYAASATVDTNCIDLIQAAIHDPHPLIRETALWALARLDRAAYDSLTEQMGIHMQYSTIERVIILKTISIFAETPADVLADVASILDVVEVRAGQAIIQKGDMGNSMYVIVNGKVRVHDGDHTLNILEDRDVFGELALLDPEPRVATVTALEPTTLFRLEQDAFYELIADRGEVARGIMRVLVRYLRGSLRDLSNLRARLEETANS